MCLKTRPRAVWIASVCALVAACAPEPPAPPAAPHFNGTPPMGFGPVTQVPVVAGHYPVGDALTQPDLVVTAATYPLRAAAADRVRIGFSGMVTSDGRTVPAPPAYETEPTIRVGGTEDKLVAVLALMAYCERPVPDAEELYRWGDEPVMRAEDTGEWQFTGFC